MILETMSGLVVWWDALIGLVTKEDLSYNFGQKNHPRGG